MEQIVLVIHLFLAVGLVVAVLMQKSEGGALGIGGSGGALVSVRGSANFLTRATAVMAACFIATSLTLAIMAGSHNRSNIDLDRPAADAPAAPAKSGAPQVPLSK
ncbi:MAG TPA: preprotein translocase subunit SecG [Rhodospirillaceae bacterium]|nr:preprotein translocase subunit SecG [Rhodospirillaceae bacterium]HAA92210.1 preprotein translocase subunit SecG [Rhodospirillaceae bacterium]HAT34296.1 preprotein translocase subunit SecG [Rhodospirillaceae bacterium]